MRPAAFTWFYLFHSCPVTGPALFENVVNVDVKADSLLPAF